MDLHELETFLSVAGEGTFSRAARRLHRTQPAISRAIRKLEDELGEPLMNRSRRNGGLTEAGGLLREYALRLLDLRDEARAALRDLQDLQRGTLTIAASDLTSRYLLPALDQYRHLYPGIRVAVCRSPASQIPHAIVQRKVEMGLISFLPQGPAFRSVEVGRDSLYLLVSPQHPLARRRQVGIRELGAETFVAHAIPSPSRASVVKLFRRYKMRLNMPVQLPTIEAIKRFVAMGNGVAILPGVCAEEEVARGELACVQVRGLSLERRLYLVRRSSGNLSHAGRAFLRLLESGSTPPCGPQRFHTIGQRGGSRDPVPVHLRRP